jgi:hypothetical protein
MVKSSKSRGRTLQRGVGPNCTLFCQQKSGTSARIFGGLLGRDDSDPAALSMSPAMSAISFVMDGVAHAANDGFVLDTGLSHCSKRLALSDNATPLTGYPANAPTQRR